MRISDRLLGALDQVARGHIDGERSSLLSFRHFLCMLVELFEFQMCMNHTSCYLQFPLEMGGLDWLNISCTFLVVACSKVPEHG